MRSTKRLVVLIAALAILSLLAGACKPEPEIIEKEVTREVMVEVTKEVVKEVEVEVQVTREVEKEVIGNILYQKSKALNIYLRSQHFLDKFRRCDLL